MSSKPSKLEQQSTSFDIVISNNDLKINNDILNLFLSKYGCLYAFINHISDNDFNHYHVVLIFEKRKRFKQILNGLADGLNVDVNSISICDVMDLTKCIQYLIHKNNPDKFQYNRNSIISNLPIDYLNELLDSDFIPTLIKDLHLIEYVKTMNNLQLMVLLGVEYYTRHRLTIKDIRDSLMKGDSIE